jgi:hypothetical protein
LSTIGRLFICGTAVAFLCGTADSQTTFATIFGNVTDSSGAVVPDVIVRAINVETNVQTETKSNSAGVYTIPQLKEGKYKVLAQAAGFKAFLAQDITLDARDLRRVEVILQVGDVGSTVEVAGGATLIETETARISDLKTAQVMKSLPLNSRGMYVFLATVPGLVATTDGFTRFAGSRANQSGWAVDGTTMADGVEGSSVGPLANYIESFQEIKIDMANNTAEFGLIGQVTIVSKSGTNQLRGSLFDYYITPFFRARNPFALQRQAGLFHTPGGSIGGPVVLPKIFDGRNRTFFFFSYETSIGSTNTTILNPTVPPASWRHGDFSTVSGAIYDPGSGAPFAGNQIPATRINPVSQKIQDRFYPLPNFGDPNTFASQNYRESKTRPWDGNIYWITRFDHKISNHDSIYGRYTWYRGLNRPYEGNLPTIGQRVNQRDIRSATISQSHIFSPSLINEARWGFLLNNNPIAGPINGPQIVKDLGVTGLAPNLPDISGLLKVSWTGLGLAPITQIDYANPGYRNHGEDIQDHLSWFHGRHNLKFGFNLSRIEWDDLAANANLFGNVTFSNRFTSLNKAGAVGGSPYADFLLGIPSSAARAFAPIRADRNRWQYDFYAVDDFKLSNKVTLNLGLRYELHPPWRETHNQLALFDIGTGKVVVPDGMAAKISPLFPTGFLGVVEASSVGLPSSTLIRADKNNFAPRFGIAYRPWGDKTVIRAGYGIFFDMAPRPVTMSGIPYLLNEPAYTNPAANPDVIFPRVFPVSNPNAPSTGIPAAVNPGLLIPYSMQYSLTVQHQAFDTGFRLSYIGTNSRKVDYAYDINSPLPDARSYIAKGRLFPAYPGISYYTNGAGHQYNGFTAEANRHFAKGFYYQASWTWARDRYDLERGDVSEDPYDRQRERAVAMGIPTHRVNLNFVYQLPFGKGRKFGNSSRLLDAFVGGWEISGVYSRFSGQFLTPLWSGPDTTGTAYTTSATAPIVSRRPDVLRDPNLAADQRTVQRWFDVSAFAAPKAGQFGDAAKGIIKGPGVNVFSSGVAKAFHIRDRMTLRAEITGTNIFNHPNWSNPAVVVNALQSSGIITGVGGVNGGATGDAPGVRVFRTALRLEF